MYLTVITRQLLVSVLMFHILAFYDYVGGQLENTANITM